MHPETLEQQTALILERVGTLPLIKDEQWYLAGGTALALQLGHRTSVDLDFFGPNDPSLQLREAIRNAGTFELVNEDAGTYDGVLDNVKVSFMRYAYPLLGDAVLFGSVFLASIPDISTMKLSAISSRGSKKDFIDLYFLIDRYGLPEVMAFFEKRHAGTNFNKVHLLKSITYFEDAEHEPMPVMLMPVSWEEVKARLTKEAVALVG